MVWNSHWVLFTVSVTAWVEDISEQIFHKSVCECTMSSGFYRHFIQKVLDSVMKVQVPSRLICITFNISLTLLLPHSYQDVPEVMCPHATQWSSTFWHPCGYENIRLGGADKHQIHLQVFPRHSACTASYYNAYCVSF